MWDFDFNAPYYMDDLMRFRQAELDHEQEEKERKIKEKQKQDEEERKRKNEKKRNEQKKNDIVKDVAFNLKDATGELNGYFITTLSK